MDSVKPPSKVDVLCIYYPEWHAYPEGDAIFGKGRSEWDLVDTATPRFKGHEQPVRLTGGKFDDSDPAAVAREIDLASGAGIDVFVYDWYWAEGRPIQHESLERGFFKAANRSKMKFALMWANHDRTHVFRNDMGKNRDRLFWKLEWTAEEFLAAIDYCIRTYFTRPEYYLKDGKPFFSVYSAVKLIKAVGGPEKMRLTLEEARRRAVSAGLAGIHFSAMAISPDDFANLVSAGYETISSYNITPLSFDENATKGENDEMQLTSRVGYDEFLARQRRVNLQSVAKSPVPYLRVATRGWDCSPRCRLEEPFPWRQIWYPYEPIVVGVRADAFAELVGQLRAAAEEDPKRPGAILINAWNEFTEGCYLLPDEHHGDSFLREIGRKLK